MYSTAQLKWKSHFVEMKILLLGSEEENLLFRNHSTLQIILCHNADVLFLIFYAESMVQVAVFLFGLLQIPSIVEII